MNEERNKYQPVEYSKISSILEKFKKPIYGIGFENLNREILELNARNKSVVRQIVQIFDDPNVNSTNKFEIALIVNQVNDPALVPYILSMIEKTFEMEEAGLKSMESIRINLYESLTKYPEMSEAIIQFLPYFIRNEEWINNVRDGLFDVVKLVGSDLIEPLKEELLLAKENKLVRERIENALYTLGVSREEIEDILHHKKRRWF